jgi:hypothetical protein
MSTLTVDAGVTTVRTVGGLIPGDLVARVLSGRDLDGLTADDFHLELGVTPREAANRAWSVLSGAWVAYRDALGRLPEGDRATGLTREKWLSVLLRELGFGRVPATPAGGISADDRAFPVSHHADVLPIHLLGWGVDLDHKTPGLAGAADRAPHAMVQELLNRSDRYLWAIVANGGTLRLLRDSSSLVGQSYVEFDLQAMFDGEVFSDFVALYLLAHQTRFEPLDPEAGPDDCWLERWRANAVETGTRALGQLRDGVKAAIESLGTGFIQHPSNARLRAQLEPGGGLELADFHRSLLRLVYRLLFCFVAEDRGLLLTPGASETARVRYADWFSTARLRRVATRRRGTRHSDLWRALSLVVEGLGREGGRPELGLPGIGGLFEHGPVDVVDNLELGNDALLAAVRHLSVIQPRDGGPRRNVDYRNLGAEELGSIYESLLELVPRHDPVTRTFALETLAGNERKTSGAYYTPTSLIDCLLDATLNPLLEDAESADDPEGALLELTVCDPACGSGHFLVAAARRIAHRLARVRADGAEPTAAQAQEAMHDVVGRCIFGVDLNPMAAELAKVSLWLESLSVGRPLGFLDAHIKVGNALLGTTPALLVGGVPDESFTAIEGDDKAVVTTLRKRNARERAGQDDLFTAVDIVVDNTRIAESVREIDGLGGLDLASVHLAQQRQRDLDASPELAAARFLADAWCAAFVATKTETDTAITDSTLRTWAAGTFPANDHPLRRVVERYAAEYRFFHWHLEFPQIFRVDLADSLDPRTGHLGWTGGFKCMIGNPPWETLSPDTREFFGGFVPGIRALSKAQKDTEIAVLLKQESYRRLWDRHQRNLFAIAHFLKRSGRYVMFAPGNLGKGDFNTYRSFAELALSMTAPGGCAGQIIQSGLYAGANSSAIRRSLIESCTWLAVFGFDNKGGTWFEGVTLENFAAYAARVGVKPSDDHEIEAAFGLPHPTTLAADLAHRRVAFALSDIKAQNPETLAVPDIRDPRQARLSRRLYRQFPPFGAQIEGLPHRDFSREIDMSDKGNVFGDDPAGVPVYEGRMIDFFDHRAKRYVSGHGNSSVWEETPFGSPRKEVWPQWRVRWTDFPNDAVRERIRGYRVGFMDVADPGRQRSFVSAVVPPMTVCGDKVPTLRFGKTPWYTPIYVAIANSLAVDFLARQRVMGKKMALNILDGLPIPRLELDDPRAAWLGRASLLLSCTSPEMTAFWNEMAEFGFVDEVEPNVTPGVIDPGERRQLRAEIDAYVARRLFELSAADVELILDSFTQLAGIEQRRDGEYVTRRLVLAAFERLEDADAHGTVETDG